MSGSETTRDPYEGQWVLATVGNVRKFHRVHGANLFAVSPATTEEFSANPGDYFAGDDGTVLRDSEGEACILAVRQLHYRPLEAEVVPELVE